jgi:hypothetical protein
MRPGAGNNSLFSSHTLKTVFKVGGGDDPKNEDAIPEEDHKGDVHNEEQEIPEDYFTFKKNDLSLMNRGNIHSSQRAATRNLERQNKYIRNDNQDMAALMDLTVSDPDDDFDDRYITLSNFFHPKLLYSCST